jgi:hypothetical protein
LDLERSARLAQFFALEIKLKDSEAEGRYGVRFRHDYWTSTFDFRCGGL